MFDKQTLKSFFMKTKLFSALAFCALTFGQAQILLQEGFDNVTSLTGWTQTNQSSPLGTSNWFQGNSTVFTAQTGAPAAYILEQTLTILRVQERLAIGSLLHN